MPASASGDFLRLFRDLWFLSVGCRAPPHRILSVCHVLAARSMEKQPASYMHENWQSGPSPFEFWKPVPALPTVELLPVPRPPHSQCFPSPKITARRPLSTVKIVYEVTTGCTNSWCHDCAQLAGLYNKCVYLDYAATSTRLLHQPSHSGEFVGRPSWESIQSGDFCYS